MVSEDPLDADLLYTWSFAGRVVLSQSQLRHVNSIYFGDTTGTSFANYLFSLGGYAENVAITQLVVQNNQQAPIRILDIHVVKSCHAPLTGTLFFNPSQGADESIYIGFNLDSADTDAKVAPAGNVTSSSPNYFTGKTVSIEPGAQQVFDLVARTSYHTCTFRYLATILNGDKKVDQLIGDGSQPFRISALVANLHDQRLSDYSVVYAGGPSSPARDEAWVRVNPKTYTGAG